jgi:hypothetical protein
MRDGKDFAMSLSPFVGSRGQSESGAREADGQSIQRLLNGSTAREDSWRV